jgi:hypothetical protein
MKTFSKVIIVGLLALLALTSVSFAAVLPNATPETQGITVDTVIQCDGIVTINEDYTSQLSNQVLNGAPLATGEVYSQSTYSNRVSAVNGQTTYVKGVELNNKNQVGDGENVATTQILEFSGVRMTGDESATIFNAGQATSGATQFMCPFTSAATTIVPPFNEAVVMGAHYDVSNIDEASQVGITGVAKTGDVPSSIHMNIAATGNGAIGTYIGVVAQDARGTGTQLVTPEKTTKIPGKTTTTVISPATTTSTTVAGHWEGCHWVPTKTTTVNTKEKTETVTTKDQKVTTPAVYTPVTPSSDIRYSERTDVQGAFVFSKNMKYTSQVG